MSGAGATLRLIAAAAALVSLGLASGCSAGQLAETSRIVPSVPGGSATVPVPNPNNPTSQILVQDVTIAYAADGYVSGSSAPLVMRVFNQTDSPITLTPGSATLQSPQSGGKSTKVGTVAWMSGGSQSAAPSASATDSPSAAPSGSSAPSASAAPSSSAAAAPLTIPPAGFVTLDPSQQRYLAITDLAAPTIPSTPTLAPGSVVNVELDFVYNNRPFSVIVPATFAPPATAPSRAAATPAQSN